jgi:hypothetical protein
MAFLNAPLVNGWAVIDVLVAVSRQRRRLLTKHGFTVPQPVHVRALLDTGSFASGFALRVFQALDLAPVTTGPVYTPSTSPNAPHQCDFYDVSLSLVAEGGARVFPDSRVMLADCWLPGEGVEALIGMDILSRCFFQLMGPDRRFTLALP